MREALYSFGRFLRRAFKDLPASIGSNHLGFWFPAIPALLFFAYQWTQTGWHRMKHDLIVGAVITVISYGLLFFYCVIRNLYREHVALVTKERNTRQELERLRDRPLWIGYDSEQAWRNSIDFQNRLIELGRSIDGYFSPLQTEGMVLAEDLGRFMRKIGKHPESPPGADFEAIFDHAVIGEGSKWFVRMKAEYEASYSPRVNQFLTNLERETGRSNARLKNYKDSVHDLANINTLRAQLWQEILYPLGIDFQGE